MAIADDKKQDAAGKNTQNATDTKTQAADEGIPILDLIATSKNGCTPCDVAGSVSISSEDGLPHVGTGTTKYIILEAGLSAMPVEPKWQVYAVVNDDFLPKPTVVKGKVCQGYTRINAVLSFAEKNADPKTGHPRLRSCDITPGEWLLPLKDGGSLLAYIRVKIEDAASAPAPEKPKPKATQDNADATGTSNETNKKSGG